MNKKKHIENERQCCALDTQKPFINDGHNEMKLCHNPIDSSKPWKIQDFLDIFS